DQFRAEHYCLVLWGHAFGLGFGRDHNVPLMLPDLKEALKAFKSAREEWSETPDGRLEILGTNACAMSYLEAAYEIREYAQLMVASQITVPFSGWPYDAILSRIEARTKPIELARLIVDAYVHQFDDLPGGDRLAMTVLDLEHARGLAERVDAVATAITSEIGRGRFNSDKLSFFRDIFMGAAAGDVRPLIDVARLCDALDGDDPVSERVRDAAVNLRRAV